MAQARLAKISRPRLYGISPRERLFQILDSRRRYPVVWLSAAPGAGKTALVASYLQVRRVPAIWYQVDDGDGDPSTFFYYLGLATARNGPPLPVLKPEYLPNLGGFARRYFRELFLRMPRNGVLVLDNYQEVPETSSLQEIVEEAAFQVPDSVTVIVISRTDPPCRLARLLASDRMAVVDWHDLRLTFEETEAIAALRGSVDRAALILVHRHSDGWVAGLTLMLERLARSGALPETMEAETKEAVFDYFAGEIFDKAPREHQQIFLATAFLPRITADLAVELSGEANAAKLLDYLYRRHLFTDRRIGHEVSYQYHALFREFLLRRARETHPSAMVTQLMRRAAQLLEGNLQNEDAIKLYLEACEWGAAIELVIKEAANLLAQGRGQTLRNWIDLLPQDAVQTAPWVLYWLGTSLIAVNPVNARCKLEEAFERFERDRDTVAQIMAVSRIIESYYFERSSFTPLDRWIESLEQLLSSACGSCSPETELRAHSAMLVATIYRQPGHRLLPASARRILQMLAAELDPDLRVSAGTFLLNYCNLAEDFKTAPPVIALIHALLQRPGVTPLSAITWWSRLGFHHYLRGECKAAHECLDEAHRIARREGIRFGDGTLFFFQTLASIDAHDLTAARAHARELERSLNPLRVTEMGYSNFANGVLALLAGDQSLGLHYGNAAIALGRETGAPYSALTFRIPFLYALVDSGDHDSVRELVAEARTLIEGTYLTYYACELLFVEAYSVLLSARPDEARHLLREAFATAHRADYAYQFRWLPGVLSRLCTAALENGIETSYVSCVIRKHAVCPGSVELEAWPWPIRIHTLGRFGVVTDGQLVQFRGKAQRRPLEMLKAVIAFGGRDVACSALVRTLWPEIEEDVGRNLFDTTLHRLRKVLGHEDGITIQDAKLSLNPARCWVDTWAFERQQKQIEKALNEQAPKAIEAMLDAAVEAYPGHFLPSDPDTPWVLGTRQRLRSKFLRLVSLAGRYWEETECWDRALLVYQHALEVDPLIEELYRAAMFCHLNLRHPADGVEVYRRCREVLSVSLGLQPSADTQAVYRSLMQG